MKNGQVPHYNEDVMDPFAYPANGAHFNLRMTHSTRKWRHYDVDFNTSQTHDFPQGIGRGEYYAPLREQNGALAILVHGWGDRSALPCRVLARSLAGHGIPCFVIYLVFHSSRMPAGMRARGRNLTDEEWFQMYQLSVIDVRRVIDWATGAGNTDSGRIGVVGISLGGIISAISMGVDSRIKAGAFIVTGGNFVLPDWYRWGSPPPFDCTQEKKKYDDYLTRIAAGSLEDVEPPRPSYLTDPMTYAAGLKQRPLLMINALWDEQIPRRGTLTFWQACGRPPIVWLPSTHASIWLGYPYIRHKLARFLQRAL